MYSSGRMAAIGAVLLGLLVITTLPVGAAGTGGLLVAEWNANTTDADLNGYRLFVTTDLNIFDLTPQKAGLQATTLIVTKDLTEATIRSLDPSLLYYVAATSIDTNGNESIFSNIVAAQPCATSTSGSLSLQWDADTSVDVEGYHVFISTDPGVFDFSPDEASQMATRKQVGRDKTEVTFRDLDIDETYFVAVTSYDLSGGETLFSEVVSAQATVTPTVCSVSPNSADEGTTSLSVTVTGAELDTGATLDFGPGVNVVSIDSSLAPDRLVAMIDIDPLARVDSRDIVVINPDGGQSTRFEAFNVLVDVARVDLNGSSRVDGGDLVAIAATFGMRPVDQGYSIAMDLNVDGVIDGADLSLLIAFFGLIGPF